MEKDMNFNYSECVKSYDNFGETIYVNICNDKKEIVPWGIDGYCLFIGVILCVIILILGIIGGIKTMIV